MFVDKTLEFSDGQALTATAVSTNVIDLGADLDIGVGQPVFLVVTVQVAPDATTGDETYGVELQSGSSATPTDVIAKFAIPRTAKVGDVFGAPVSLRNERYLSLNYPLGGTTPSITVNAFLTSEEPAVWRALPGNV